ncbi:MAG: DsbA family protein [Roseitalea sp.]|jgi:protein-disulfide isomerase|uniref:DsbA family protein n=1 Tax=Oceaniradius stylonematis TaxID=2184161 RepID=A0A3A8AKZ1_9HYPH|nr:DsbA family protein [Oceaniradius stylonematis]MBO6553106.1 DsbA family protein [Roseitalea sp.]MBO6951134.1 DsbA family protein [Rhizobiaceae bacterium]RNC93837.1 MAG: DsbA family protein [Oricola sp.]MBO6590879.1 DsbA family protein [Roseitalea sp.]MBO6599863.1 DsbA family protein [Roseitalea sp.]
MPRFAVQAIAALALCVALPLTPAWAQSFDEAQRTEIGEIVRDYLLANPEVMIEVQEALEAQRTAEEDQRRKDVIASAADDLFRHPADPVLGNPDGDVTIVEFFDYNCGFCRRAMEDMNALIETDPNLRFVLKEFPILGEDSQAAHMVALAFNRLMPQSYAAFHEQLMNVDGRANEEAAVRIAVALGADEAALRREMANPQNARSVETTYLLAEALGITGTPSYVIGDQMVPGALGERTLRDTIASVRDATN